MLPEMGITRTTLCFSVNIELEQSQKLAAEVLTREFDKLIRSDAAQVVASKRGSPHEPSLIGFSRDNGARVEPSVEFSPSFAVGLQAHELLSHAYGDRSRATKPTRAFLGVPLGTKRCVDTVPIASEPSPVIPIVDFEFEKDPRSDDGFGLHFMSRATRPCVFRRRSSCYRASCLPQSPRSRASRCFWLVACSR